MCSSPDSLKPKSAMAVGVATAEAIDDVAVKQKGSGSVLLELAAADDLLGFKRALEEGGLEVDLSAPWYGRWGRKMGIEARTPLMVAAMYGSTAILRYILSTGVADVNRSCGSDGATALHLAAAGGAPSCADAVRMLVDASANVDAVDAVGNKPGDVIPRKPVRGGSPRSRSPEDLLKVPVLDGSTATASAITKEASPAKQGEKKEYPADLTLPDIKNGFYGTDEFRMYVFKVKPCSRAYSHDWTECPFVHPGENARRRDPRKYPYSCVPCPEFRKGACRNGDACEYAHGVFESWLHPAQYRTRLCKDETGCNRRVCFFAHKPEELRAPTSPGGSMGSVLPSPRSPGLPSLDVSAAAAAAAASLMLNQPMSPTAAASSAMSAASVWLNQAGSGLLTPTRQLPGSRLKTGLFVRSSDVDMELLGLEGYQKQLLDDFSNLSSPNSWKSSFGGAAAPCASDYGDLLGSLESPSLLSQIQGLSLRQSAAAAGTGASQFQSLSGAQLHQGMNQQLFSSYTGNGGNLPSSPSLRTSSGSSFAVDPSLAAAAAAIMNSRSSAFAKRSQSFIDRGVASRLSSLSTVNTATITPDLYNWGSPDGKLDWGFQGEEFNKLKKSASFGFRGNGNSAAAAMAAGSEEPDVSWVQSLVKDGPSPPGHVGAGRQQKQHKVGNLSELRAQDLLPPWAEQLYMEQEQTVA